MNNAAWRSGELPRGAAMLVVKRGANAGSRFMLDRPITSVGRHVDSDVVLADASVSEHHAEFHWEGAGFRIADVGSTGGTYVNRELIGSAALASGDEIEIGTFRLVFLTTTA